MTCVAACVGLLPAAVSTGMGSQVQKPLALVVVGGNCSSPYHDPRHPASIDRSIFTPAASQVSEFRQWHSKSCGALKLFGRHKIRRCLTVKSQKVDLWEAEAADGWCGWDFSLFD